MRVHVLIIAAALFLISCKRDRYDPSHQFSDAEQAMLIRQMSYYVTKLAPNAGELDKFDAKYDWYYDRAASECRLLALYPAQEPNSWYFLLARKARSLTPMDEGIGGILKLNASGALADYEEVFRVWKMQPDTLVERGSMLFDRMVRGKDLSLFYPKFQKDRYIELPTEGYYFDKASKRWRSTSPN